MTLLIYWKVSHIAFVLWILFNEVKQMDGFNVQTTNQDLLP